jgi:hypothetical protein
MILGAIPSLHPLNRGAQVPDWCPPPLVRFDHAGAEDLLAEIRLTGDLLLDVTEAVRRAADDASESWFGRPEQRAAVRLARHRIGLAAAQRQLDQLTRSLMAAADDARAEQRRRRILRQEWDADRNLDRGAALLSWPTR